MSEQRSNYISPGVIAAVSAAVVTASGIVAFLAWNSGKNLRLDPGVQKTQPVSSALNNRTSQEKGPRIYWLQDSGKNFKLVAQSLKVSIIGEPNQILTKAFQILFAGPTEGKGSTTIPLGTKLLSIKQENNSVYLNLSSEFISGGGSASMQGRLGQVLYTATSLNKNANVYIQVDGKPLNILGGEGVELQQPMTRTDFKQEYQP
ncbi:hypothetical protein RINTHM_6790 [Richelia intracellularis HM01]|uniref:GerMN domain-containing protein n=1 Tax=Richelia intracellularis TaxID=1164990 RepID=UPI0002B5CE18|nr:GerMN domain-containing protein [Richelia intracellularis]CCH65145.1 hypothetical protein RINTHM_6790 [Richelia intracellularis HM01]